MAQETNALETRNTGGLLDTLTGVLAGFGKIVTTTAPLAAEVYQLKLQGDVLKNQSQADLQKLQDQQKKLALAASTPGPAGLAVAQAVPKWVLGAGAAVLALLLFVLIRRRRG